MRVSILSFMIALFSFAQIQGQPAAEKKIFVYGGGFGKEFVRYIKEQTGKSNPKVCFLPTASGDSERGIINFFEVCSDQGVQPSVMRVWIASPTAPKSWEEILLDVDAIIVGGGNTLNMMAIWKAQGIDIALKKAYEKGIVMAGGSAGSLCWFKSGTTDSRPKELTIVECLGFLDFSHCPHYHSEEARRPLYHKNILSGNLAPGYACDDRAGLLFINGTLKEAVSTEASQNSYFVTVKDGKISEEKLTSRILK